MILLVCLALAAFAAAIVLAAPAVLVVGRWQVRHPRLALSAWSSAIGVGLAAAVASIAVALAAAVGAVPLAGPTEGVVVTLLAWVALFGLAALVALTAVTGEHWERGWSRDERRALRSTHPAIEIRGVRVLVVDSDVPVACSAGGSDAVVLVSTGVRDGLSREQLEAVVEHEQAHVSERHHLVRELAAFQVACLPWLPAARALDRATRLLVELVADDVAARRVGAVHAANALALLGTLSSEPTMALRAERLADRRWRPRRRAARQRSVGA